MIWTSRVSSSNRSSNRPSSGFSRETKPGGLTYLVPARLLVEEGVALAFSLRHGGCSLAPFATLNFSLSQGDHPANVQENRRRLLTGLDLPLPSLALVRQMHGADLRLVGRDRTGTAGDRLDDLPEADALITGEKGVSLAVLTADCLPVVLVSRGGGPIACIHAGRKGLAAGIVARAAASLRDMGADPERMLAFIGPGIRACC